ncbi:MAG: DNA-binding protein [Verrucomicrobia bacterium]|nr:DNA-binding protein [Verrucomicrobiota bacterium]
MKSEFSQVVREGLDENLPALRSTKPVARKPTRGWLRAVREAIGLSQEVTAIKIGVRRQSYADMEAAEAIGSISLLSLERAANALDCDLVYFLVPREEVARTYDQLARIHEPLFKHLQASEHSMALENQAVGDITPKPKPAK